MKYIKKKGKEKQGTSKYLNTVCTSKCEYIINQVSSILVFFHYYHWFSTLRTFGAPNTDFCYIQRMDFKQLYVSTKLSGRSFSDEETNLTLLTKNTFSNQLKST